MHDSREEGALHRIELPVADRYEATPLDRACFNGLLAVVILAALPLGSARPWSSALLCCAVAMLLLLWGIDGLRRPSQDPPRRRVALTVPTLLFGGAVGWGLLQTVSWTPLSWHHPLWSEIARFGFEPAPGSVSVVPNLSLGAAGRLLAYAAIFYLSYEHCRRSENARRVLAAVAAAGLGYAVYGLASYWAGNATILWYEKWAYEADLTSVFVSRNAFAAYAGLSLLATVALILHTVARSIDFDESRRAVAAAILTTISGRSAWMFIGFVALATALLLTHSRAGFSATIAGLAAALLAAFASPGLRRPGRLLFSAVLILGLVGIVTLSGDATADRFATVGPESEGRVEIYRATIEALGATPLLGTGLGSFPDIFAAYRTPAMPFRINAAHNDYLQAALELGVPATASLVLALATLGGFCVAGTLRRRRNAVFPCLGVGVTVLVGAHSLVDFSLQVPAVSATYALLLGAAVAQSARTPPPSSAFGE
jgi:O-antigen ligase